MTIRDEVYYLEEIISTTCVGTVSGDSFHCIDTPFDILAIPLGKVTIKNGDQVICDTNKVIGLNFSRALATALGDWFMDAQILPYCPCQDMFMFKDDGTVDIANYAENKDYGWITDKPTGNKLSWFFFGRRAYREFNITKLADTWDAATERDISEICKINDRKVDNETDLWRLVSPNFASQFDFSLTKCVPLNETSLKSFNVDVAFRPHNPYIHVNPDFGFLYGRDFNDSRGLILSGDFGITTLSDAWVNYQIQNKNYQNAFDRSQQNLETNRDLQRQREQWAVDKSMLGLPLSFLGGGAGGAIGGMIGGTAGGIIGGMAGLTGGLAGNILNIGGNVLNQQLNEKAYQEQRSFNQDMFNMSLENIQALPQSITHQTSITNNFKYFPILEYYSCTDKEVAVLNNKIRYNGMTVGKIGALSEFIDSTKDLSFIKGQIIKLDDLNDDAHLAQDIYNEVNKGLFYTNVQLPENMKELKDYYLNGIGNKAPIAKFKGE